MHSVFGVDLSNNNPDINAALLAQNVDFVFHKATEGTGFVDKFYALRGSALMGHGVPFGAYHYARVHEDARAQVGHFLNVAKLQAGMLVPFLDCEGSGNEGATAAQWREFITAWMHEMLNVHNRRCGVYVSPGFADAYGFGDLAWLRECYLFVAHWGVPKPRIPAPWSRATIWQTGSQGHVSGVVGHVDTDTWLDTFMPWVVTR
jgi:lysozyme